MVNEFEVRGVDAVIERFEGIASGEKIYQAMGKACARVERTAKQAPTPKDTGTLRNSIQSKVEIDGNKVIGTIFTPLEYAPYVEYGTGLFAENGQGRKTGWAYEDEKTGETIWTRGQKPQPFLRPALNNNREKIVEDLKEGMND